MPELDTVPVRDARALLLHGQGLSSPPKRATAASVQKTIDRLGYVQIDSIRRVERAHHLILAARLDDYEPRYLKTLHEKKRSVFEHWTHDAAVIPTAFYGHWKPYFDRYARRAWKNVHVKRRLGSKPKRVVDQVLERIRTEGPLRSSDFEDARKRKSAGFWDWKPQKMALEYLWRSGRLAVAGRQEFQKIYDLVERVLPEDVVASESSPEEALAWACHEALDRLGVANPGELSHYWWATPAAEVKKWCVRAVASGEIVPVRVESADGSKPRPAYALPDWKRRAIRVPDPPDELRLLAPFDPLIHDRRRTQRLFDFEFTVEIFVPPAKRRYGYYVFPMLEGERFVGRIEPRIDAEREALVVDGLWWEPGVRVTRKRKRALDHALERLAALGGVEKVELKR